VVEKSVVKIAVDPHKRINAGVAVDATGKVLARGTFAHSTTGFADLMGFARRWPRREWAIEGATGVGKNLAQRLVVKGEIVFDVPSKKSSLVRAFSATSGRKSDEVDAYSVALASLHSELLQVRVDERAETFLTTERCHYRSGGLAGLNAGSGASVGQPRA
jgi:transposase